MNYPTNEPWITKDRVVFPAGAAVRFSISGPRLDVGHDLGLDIYLKQPTDFMYYFSLDQAQGDTYTGTFYRMLSTFRPRQ